MHFAEYRTQADGRLIALALAIKLSAPVDKIVHWFLRYVVDEGGFAFSGTHHEVALRDYEPRFHALYGILEPREKDQTLTEKQVSRFLSWVRTQDRHLGPTAYSVGLTPDTLEERRARDPNYPLSILHTA